MAPTSWRIIVPVRATGGRTSRSPGYQLAIGVSKIHQDRFEDVPDDAVDSGQQHIDARHPNHHQVSQDGLSLMSRVRQLKSTVERAIDTRRSCKAL